MGKKKSWISMSCLILHWVYNYGSSHLQTRTINKKVIKCFEKEVIEMNYLFIIYSNMCKCWISSRQKTNMKPPSTIASSLMFWNILILLKIRLQVLPKPTMSLPSSIPPLEVSKLVFSKINKPKKMFFWLSLLMSSRWSTRYYKKVDACFRCMIMLVCVIHLLLFCVC